MNVPPQIIKVKRRRDEDPVQALVVNKNKKIRGPTDGNGESSSSWLSPDSTVYRLQRTEGKDGEVQAPGEGRFGIPVVRAAVSEAVTATVSAIAPPLAGVTVSLSVTAPIPGSATPNKRKGAPESPLTPVGVSGISHNPPTIVSTQTTILTTASSTVPRHGHPPGGKENASLLQVPQPRKYHLAHRIGYRRGSASGYPAKWGTGSPKKSAVFMEGDEPKLGSPVGLGAGGAAGLHREKKRRRERKEELRVMLSRECLKEKENADIGAGVAAPAVSTRKRPNVNLLEKKQNEERKKKLLGKAEAGEPIPVDNEMDTDQPKAPQKTTPVESSRGKDAHRHPVRDNIDNGDDELAKQLQAMVLEYLNDQDGITNLPTTSTATTRKKPVSRQQKLIGGGVGGGSWEKVEMRRSGSGKSESDAALTVTEDESELSESEYVYDVYVKQTIEHRKLVSATGAAVAGAAVGAAVDAESQISGMKPGEYGVLVISNSDDEEWFYEGGWEDEDKSEPTMSDGEDSNAEDYHTNDYPEEEEAEDDSFDDDDDDEYVIDDEGESFAYSWRTGHPNYLLESDDEGDSESESYEKVGSRKWCRSRIGGRRRFAPGEEEYDLAEDSGSEDTDGGKVRSRLERGVWGSISRGSVIDGEGDEEMT